MGKIKYEWEFDLSIQMNFIKRSKDCVGENRIQKNIVSISLEYGKMYANRKVCSLPELRKIGFWDNIQRAFGGPVERL